MRIRDWSSDVCSSDLGGVGIDGPAAGERIVIEDAGDAEHRTRRLVAAEADARLVEVEARFDAVVATAHGEVTHRHRRHVEAGDRQGAGEALQLEARSEEHTSELQSLMSISYAVFFLKKQTTTSNN